MQQLTLRVRVNSKNERAPLFFPDGCNYSRRRVASSMHCSTRTIPILRLYRTDKSLLHYDKSHGRRSKATVNMHQWLLMAIVDYRWLLLASLGNWKLLLFTDCYWWSVLRTRISVWHLPSGPTLRDRKQVQQWFGNQRQASVRSLFDVRSKAPSANNFNDWYRGWSDSCPITWQIDLKPWLEIYAKAMVWSSVKPKRSNRLPPIA